METYDMESTDGDLKTDWVTYGLAFAQTQLSKPNFLKRYIAIGYLRSDKLE